MWYVWKNNKFFGGMRIFCRNFSKNERFLSILTKNHGSGSLNQKNASHQFIWALLMLETQYLVKLESLGVQKKVVREFLKFWDFPPILARKRSKMGIRTQIWPFLGQNRGKISKFRKFPHHFFSTPKDSNLTKYWVYSINRAQINWWKAFF